MPLSFSKSTKCFKPASGNVAPPQITEQFLNSAQLARVEFIERDLRAMFTEDNVAIVAYATQSEPTRDFMMQCWVGLDIRLVRELEHVAELAAILGDDIYADREELLAHCDKVALVVLELERRTPSLSLNSLVEGHSVLQTICSSSHSTLN